MYTIFFLRCFIYVFAIFNPLGEVLLNKKWNYFAFVSTFLTVIAQMYVGSRNALLKTCLGLLLFIFYGLFDNSIEEPLLQKLKAIVLSVLVIIFTGLTLVLNSNRLYKGKAKTLFDIVHTFVSYSDLEKNKHTKSSLSSDARIQFYTISKQDITSNPLLSVGLGNL